MKILQVKVSDIVFRDDLYPRIQPDSSTIQRYAEDLEVLPPIEVNQNKELIDGYHRWTAHRKMEAELISVFITHTSTENEFLQLAIERNSKHGYQLSARDKKKMAVRLYAGGTGFDKSVIAKTLSISEKSVSRYVSDIDKQLREERNQKILDMWLACYSQEEIAEVVGVSHTTVSRAIESFVQNGQLSKMHKTFDTDPDFTPPLYNVWTFAKKSNAVSHFGNSEQRIVDNLLYLYTEPLDIVLDVFAGGGSTIDVCKNRGRRYWVSDRKPIVERENDIRKWDINDGLPPLDNRWSDVSLTYLDPPYWKQAENQYSTDSEDLANMPLNKFTDVLAGLVNDIANKQSKGVIALLIQPTQWKTDGREFADHITDLIKAVDSKHLILENRVSCPYSTEQYNAQQVNWAKEHKKLLVITRELIVWRLA